MAYFIRFVLVLGLAVFGVGTLLVGSADGAASAQTDADKVIIFSGFETEAAERTRTIIRTRRRGDRLIVDKWRVRLGSDRELDGGQNGSVQGTPGRASTGRSVEATRNGVRVINGRGGSRNLVRTR